MIGGLSGGETGELEFFFAEYGCRPTNGSSLGSRVMNALAKTPAVGNLEDTMQKMAEAPLLQARMQKQVDAFLKDWRSGSKSSSHLTYSITGILIRRNQRGSPHWR